MSDDVEVISAPPGFDDGSAFAPDETPADTTPEAAETPVETAAETPPADPVAPAPVAPPSVPDPQKGILRDLQAERQARQQAQEEAARLRGQLEGLQMAQARGPQAPETIAPAEAAKLTTWAHRFGLYTSDGQPDIQAAKVTLDELRSDIGGDVDQRVNQRVQPVVQVLQQAHAKAKVDDIVRIGSEFQANPDLLRQFATNLADVQPQSLDDPSVVAGLIGLARGMSAISQPTQAAPALTPAQAIAAATSTVAPTPNLTETPGRRVAATPSLSQMERSIASRRGMTEAKWAETAKQFEKMDPNRGLVVE